uniref:Uncharacterized protein n=1 Tax=Physcomitrium patens TaxID=3218 RepID=A0A2K1K6N9_PHYPA|nr:hypothetical protein PHYPA_011333 [Physcomitrium patens]
MEFCFELMMKGNYKLMRTQILLKIQILENQLLTKLQIQEDKPTKKNSNNMSCIKVANNLVIHSRTKHIELQHHYTRKKIH